MLLRIVKKFRSDPEELVHVVEVLAVACCLVEIGPHWRRHEDGIGPPPCRSVLVAPRRTGFRAYIGQTDDAVELRLRRFQHLLIARSEEHTSELQSPMYL